MVVDYTSHYPTMPKQTFFNLPDEKREQILDVVIDEFAENDYANVSISRIVANAGIAKGSFYQYFDDKDDLYGYLFDLILEAKSEMFSLDQPDPAHIGVFAYMRWVLENSVQFELKYPRFSQIGYRMLKGGAQADVLMARSRGRQRQFYQQLVVLGKEQGDISPDVDSEIGAYIFDMLISDLGRFMIERTIGRHGAKQLGEVPFFEIPENRQTFAQALRILEFGMRTYDPESAVLDS
jgi:TetR/AcrR family transcriptional regulator